MQSGADAAQLFFDELLQSVESIGAIADTYGTPTLAQLMFLQSAILKGTVIKLYPDEAERLSFVLVLPSGGRWWKHVSQLPLNGRHSQFNAKYALTPALSLGATDTYNTGHVDGNTTYGSDPKRNQINLQTVYSLSKCTEIYLEGMYQHVTGKLRGFCEHGTRRFRIRQPGFGHRRDAHAVLSAGQR
jgi:hypothetical protein